MVQTTSKEGNHIFTDYNHIQIMKLGILVCFSSTTHMAICFYPPTYLHPCLFMYSSIYLSFCLCTCIYLSLKLLLSVPKISAYIFVCRACLPSSTLIYVLIYLYQFVSQSMSYLWQYMSLYLSLSLPISISLSISVSISLTLPGYLLASPTIYIYDHLHVCLSTTSIN